MCVIQPINMNKREPKLKVIPFLDTKEHGIFATRSHAQPNPIGFSVVKLEKIERNILFVKGIDIIENTPLLDIKPFVPVFDVRESSRNGWLEEAHNKLKTVKDDGRFVD